MLAKQVGEHAVASELGRRGVVATTFSGNMPDFDILGIRADNSQIQVQVKATRAPEKSWFCGDSKSFFEIEATDGQERVVSHRAPYPNDFYWVFVQIATERSEDQFFILTDTELVSLSRQIADAWLAGKAGRRLSVNPVVLDTVALAPFRDKWDTIAVPK